MDTVKKRWTAKTPTFWKKVQKVGLVAGAVGGVLIAAPIALPATLIALGGYLVTAGTTYVVTFQDTFEKIANNVKVSGCVVSRPGQLILNGPNSNKGTNTGIRYINQSPNGLPKNSPPIPT